MLVKVRRGALKSLAAFFTAGVALALDPTPSFTLQSWEVLAKEGARRCEDPRVQWLMPVATSFAIRARSRRCSPLRLITRPRCGAETAHLNSLAKVRKTDFDIHLLSSTVGLWMECLIIFKNLHSTRKPLTGLCPLSWFQCDNVMPCGIIACVEGRRMLLSGALTGTK